MLFISLLYIHIIVKHTLNKTVYYEENSVDLFIVGLPPAANGG